MEDQKEIWTFPLKKESWKKPELWIVVGVSTPSFGLDGDPARRLRNDSSFTCFNNAMTSGAADVIVAGLPLMIAAAGELAGKQGVADIGWKMSEAALDAFLVSTVWKAATQRSRPHTGQTYGFWEGGNSFPSGHATIAWALAATTARHFDQHKWVPWVVYPVAGVVSFSRLTSGNHFPSDAVFGSALGFVIGRHVVH